MLILTEATADRIKKEKLDHLGKEMVKKILVLAEMYYKKFKVDEFWMMLTGKPDLYTGKLNVAIRMFDKKNRPDYPLIASQMWHIVWSKGLAELDWILPLKKKGEHYTKGNKLIIDSLGRAENYFGQPLVSKEDH